MRAREFVTEGSGGRGGVRSAPNREFEAAHPGLIGPYAKNDVYWGRYYDFYRVATLAGMDIDKLEKMDDISFFGNLPCFSAYTEHDRKKLIAIMKKLGMKPNDSISNGSHETNGTNSVSPIKPFRGYPR